MSSAIRTTLIRFSAMLIAAGCLFASEAASANAGDWIFRRSYYTHAVPQHLRRQYPLPQSRSAYRPAIVGHLRGISVQGGYRINTIIIQSGSSRDLTVIREFWFRVQ